MKSLLVHFFILLSLQVAAQEEAPEQAAPPAAETPAPAETPKLTKPLGRTKSATGVNNESSSFMGDPDNLDPLNPNRDNLKDDNEPVLEDIKTVLNAPKKKKKPGTAKVETPTATSTPEAAAATPAEPPPPEVAPAPAVPAAPEPPPPVVEAAPAPAPAPVPEKSNGLAADDPDLILEKKFNEIFKRYNINPTPDDVWAAASSKQTARVYEVQKGDTLWSISKILFGDPNFWPKLWALNKQGILNPHFINPKMKVYFYEGDEENAPTLSVGAQAKKEEEKESDEPAEMAEMPPPPEAPEEASVPAQAQAVDPNSPEAKPHVAYARQKPNRPAPLPPSLPISRNERYFGKPKIDQRIVVDLGKEPEFPITSNNDLVVSDEPAKSDVQILISEVSKFRCGEGRLLKEIEYSGTLAPEYDIYERLPDLETTTGTKYVYRLYGHALPYQGKFLRVTDCSSIIATDLIIVAKDKMKEMNTRKVSETVEAKLIGGPDVRDQRLFEKLQYAFVDFGGAAFSAGQEYQTISQLTDKVNSEFKIIEKYGSYAVVRILEVIDTIEVGDKVVTK